MSEQEQVGYDLDAIRQRVNILDVARAYVPEMVHLSGGQWRGLCPLHEERTPSFDVSEEKQVFLCRGCNQGGDVFTLVQAVEHITFVQAAAKLNAMNGGGYTPPAELPKRKKTSKSEPWHGAKVYDKRELHERGHDMAFLDSEFGVKRGITEREGAFWQYHTLDEEGRPGRGRKKFKDPSQNNGNKYLWLPGDDNPIPCCYPAWKLTGAETLWLVNGEPSVWLCWQEKIEAVCTLSETSTKRLPELMKLLRSLNKDATLHVLLDNDDAGRQGTVNVYKAAIAERVNVVAHKWFPSNSFKRGYDVGDLFEDERRDQSLTFEETLLLQPEATLADLEAWEAGESEAVPDFSQEGEGGEDVEMAEPVESDRPALVDVNKELPQWRKCPECGAHAIKKSNAAMGGGWWCDRSLDGCGTKFGKDDERIKSQSVKVGRPSGSKTGGSVEAQVEKIRSILDECPLLKSATGQAFIKATDEIGHVVIPIDGEQFTDHVVLLGEEHGMTLKKDAIAAIRSGVGARARRHGEEAEFYLRVGGMGDRVYIDLCNRKRQVVEIGEDVPDGWRVLDAAPDGLYFRRPSEQGAMPVPVRTTDADERAALWEKLEDFLQPGGHENFVKMISWALQCLRPPRGPYMGICMTGRSRSGKTQRCRMLARIVDSPKSSLQRASDDPRNFHAMVNSIFILGFENVSNIQQWMSDDLCQIMTGGILRLRKMRTNLELETIEARRPVIFNGITEFIKQSDLKARFFFAELTPVAHDKKRAEPELFADFYAYLPRFLGLMLDCVATALRHINDPEILAMKWGEGEPDIGRWISAAEFPGGLPWAPGVFQEVYKGNIVDAAQATMEDSLLAQAVWSMLEEAAVEQNSIDGSVLVTLLASDLLNRLTRHAVLTVADTDGMRRTLRHRAHQIQGDLDTMTAAQLYDELGEGQQRDIEARSLKSMEKSNKWPSSPEALAKWLQNDANQLEVMGIYVTKGHRSHRGRHWDVSRGPVAGWVEGEDSEEDVFDDE